MLGICRAYLWLLQRLRSSSFGIRAATITGALNVGTLEPVPQWVSELSGQLLFVHNNWRPYVVYPLEPYPNSGSVKLCCQLLSVHNNWRPTSAFWIPEPSCSFCATSVVGKIQGELALPLNCQSVSFCLLFSFSFLNLLLSPYGG